MVFIDEIVSVTDTRGECRTTIHPDCVFAIDGRVHASAMIEFVAQVCAIFVGVRAARDGKPPRLGVLMGCREVAFSIDSFAVGDELVIAATKIYGEHQLAAFTGTVSRGDAVCASVQLSVVDAQAAVAGGSAE
jgi:predicted hotdog family 3-hydroxylacyl-ACP dehydratase